MDKMNLLKRLIGPTKSSTSNNEGDADHQLTTSTTSQSATSNTNPSKSISASRLDDPEVRLEEKLRKKAFAHYDCQSIAADIHGASILCHILARRRNTTTGASAASMNAKNPEEVQDDGDGRSNNLVLTCPYFRNELGGEEERVIYLSRATTDHSGRRLSQVNSPFLHRPSLACGLSLLDSANEQRWKIKSCPYQKLNNEKTFVIENYDVGALYYREYFYGLDHQNWFGVDETFGPLAISIRKERITVPPSPSSSPNRNSSVTTSDSSDSSDHQIRYQYRLIIRTSDLSVLRGTVYEVCIPGLSSSSSRHNHHLNHHAKEVLEYITPEISLSCLKLGAPTADEQLLKLDEQVLTRTYKVGVLLCRNGQSTEEEMYNNESASPMFEQFLSLLGNKVPLKDFGKYRAGLDNKNDTTGTDSVYTSFNDCEIMFHVSTLLPYTPNNRQQLLRKRHIGNDIVTIIFQEPHAKPFTPKTIRSQFQHVFIIVRQVSSAVPGQIEYQVAVSRSKEVPVFGPPIPDGGLFTVVLRPEDDCSKSNPYTDCTKSNPFTDCKKSYPFTDFLLSKIINAENAAHRSEKFTSMAQRTRHEYLKDLAKNHTSNTNLNDVAIGTSAGAKLVSTIFGATRRARNCRSTKFIGDSVVKGAIVWEVSVEDFGQAKIIDCLLGISSDTFILLEEPKKEVIFVTPNSSILGWSSLTNHIKIYFHQGESLLLECKDADLDEIDEIASRLKAVTSGCETQEMLLRRNTSGQLGFHVNHEGIVTDVERYSSAWQVGLRHSFRIVEICKVAFATLNLDEVTDLLKTSLTVSVTVLPPGPDGAPRRGCNLANCSYLASLTSHGGGGEYENIAGLFERTTLLSSDRRKRRIPPKGPPYTVQGNMPGFSSSKSTPVSPEHLSDAQSVGSSPRGAIKKHYSLKSSTSAFSALSPAISFPEFNQPELRLPKSMDSHYYSQMSRQYMPGPLVKTRSEISLTNPSPPPSAFNAIGKRFPSPSRSHSQHFGKMSKQPPIYPYTQQPQRIVPSQVPMTYRTKVNPASSYYSDSSSSQDIWSLPPFPHSTTASQSTATPASVKLSPHVPHPHFSHALERRESTLISHNGNLRPNLSPFLQTTGNIISQQIQGPPVSISNSSNSAFERVISRNKQPILQPQQPVKSQYQQQQPQQLHQLQQQQFTRPTGYSSERLRTKASSSKSSSSSCNGSSTLQEDLLKLINPDYVSDPPDIEVSSSSGAETISTTQYSTPYSSLERSRVNGNELSHDSNDIVTVANPAQVVSPASSPPVETVTNGGSVSMKKEPPVPKPPRSSPQKSSSSGSSSYESAKLPFVKDDNDIDWPSLVDTANRAMAMSQERDANSTTDEIEEQLALLSEFDSTVGSFNRETNDAVKRETCQRIKETIDKLKLDLMRSRGSETFLQLEMRKLIEENQRLKEELKRNNANKAQLQCYQAQQLGNVLSEH